MTEQQVHQGRNIKRFREMFGIKQEALAMELGDDWSQKKVSLMESKEALDAELLEQVAKILKVPAEAIRNFSEEQAVNIISNTINNSDNATGNSLYSYYSVINPVEKWVEALDENKDLYRQLLQSEKDKIALLEQMIDRLTSIADKQA